MPPISCMIEMEKMSPIAIFPVWLAIPMTAVGINSIIEINIMPLDHNKLLEIWLDITVSEFT